MDDDDAVITVHEIDEPTAELIASWADARALARKTSGEESELRERVHTALMAPDGTWPGQAQVGDRHTLHVQRDGRLVLVLRVIPSSRTDATGLRRAYPGIAEQFTVSGHSTRLDAP